MNYRMFSKRWSSDFILARKLSPKAKRRPQGGELSGKFKEFSAVWSQLQVRPRR